MLKTKQQSVYPQFIVVCGHAYCELTEVKEDHALYWCVHGNWYLRMQPNGDAFVLAPTMCRLADWSETSEEELNAAAFYA